MVQLVAIPPIHLPSFSKWDPQRKDDVYLYVSNHSNRTDSIPSNREAYRYKLTIIDHPTLIVQRTKPIPSRRATKSSSTHRQHNDIRATSSSSVIEGVETSTKMSFTYTNAVFLIPAGRETEYIFSSLSGLRSILKSANTARLIAVAFGRNFSSVSENRASSIVNDNNMSIEIVQEELRYVVQMIASAIPNETLEASISMKPDTSSTFYPFLALNGIGQRDIVDSGTTTCSGRYIVEQCAISSSDDNNNDGDNDQQQWVRRLYFLDGNPNVIQSEVYLSRIEKSNDTTIEGVVSCSNSSADSVWTIDKSVTAFDYHKSLTAGLFAYLPTPNQPSALTYNGLLIGLGGGSLINFWHYIHGDINIDNTPGHMYNLWNVTAVELDEAIVQIASKNFGLSVHHPSLHIKIGDGLDVHCTESTTTTVEENPHEPTNEEDTSLAFQKESFDFIVLDVDSKETGAGMSCPPESFVKESYLQTLFALLHPERGILAINVAARDVVLFHKTCRAVRCVFPYIFLSKRYPNIGYNLDVVHEYDTDREPEDLNVVVFATRSMLYAESFLTSIPDLSDRIGQWMLLYNDTDDNAERALLQSILKECLTDFVPHNDSDEESSVMNGAARQEPTMHSSKSGNNSKRRKNRGGNNKKR